MRQVPNAYSRGRVQIMNPFVLIHFLKISQDMIVGKGWRFQIMVGLLLPKCASSSIGLMRPFSISAVEKCKLLPIKALKIGSGEIQNTQLIEACIHACPEIIVSTGMSDWTMISIAIIANSTIQMLSLIVNIHMD